MFVGEAKKLCADLVCVPYQFDLYEKASRSLFEILSSFTKKVEIVSCDEAFVDVTKYCEVLKELSPFLIPLYFIR